ncbi:hypothetical protein [Caldisphaera lagunensis]|nr:hypothetical protein [Caldisphaera lagunensis]
MVQKKGMRRCADASFLFNEINYERRQQFFKGRFQGNEEQILRKI